MSHLRGPSLKFCCDSTCRSPSKQKRFVFQRIVWPKMFWTTDKVWWRFSGKRCSDAGKWPSHTERSLWLSKSETIQLWRCGVGCDQSSSVRWYRFAITLQQLQGSAKNFLIRRPLPLCAALWSSGVSSREGSRSSLSRSLANRVGWRDHFGQKTRMRCFSVPCAASCLFLNGDKLPKSGVFPAEMRGWTGQKTTKQWFFGPEGKSFALLRPVA